MLPQMQPLDDVGKYHVGHIEVELVSIVVTFFNSSLSSNGYPSTNANLINIIGIIINIIL